MVRTVNDLYLSTRRSLRNAGVESAELEAKLLLCHALSCTKEELLSKMQMYAGENVQTALSAFTERRLRGEPVAYITGMWEFCGLPMEVTPAVLIPRNDTEVLVEEAVRHLRSRHKSDARILDLGCGSGCIGIALGHFLPGSRVTFVDISPEAAEIAKRNVQRNGLIRRSAVLEGNILEAPPMRMGEYDLLVSNPPYIASAEIDTLDISVKEYEPRLALDGGEDGLQFYRSILSRWLSVLSDSGSVIMEIGEGQSEPVQELMRSAGLQEVHSALDNYGTERLVIGTK